MFFSIAQLTHATVTAKVLRDEGCALVGGHTSEGAEPALGLAVNGTVLPDRVLSKGPLKVGDVLVLTKALGTGTILAADMRAKAKGRWVGAAISSMVQSNRAAAKILYAHGCSACTDVTGFGFLGHLIEMIQFGEEAGGVAADGLQVGAHISERQQMQQMLYSCCI